MQVPFGALAGWTMTAILKYRASVWSLLQGCRFDADGQNGFGGAHMTSAHRDAISCGGWGLESGILTVRFATYASHPHQREEPPNQSSSSNTCSTPTSDFLPLPYCTAGSHVELLRAKKKIGPGRFVPSSNSPKRRRRKAESGRNPKPEGSN